MAGLEPVVIVLGAVAVERGLEGVDVVDPSPLDEGTGCCQFILGEPVGASFDLEQFIPTHQERIYLLCEPTLLLAPINKTIELLGVSMEIQHKLYPRVLHNELLHRMHLWVEPLIGALPLPVNIIPRQVGPEVPIDHPIYVQHRHADDLELLKEPVLLAQSLEQGLHDMGGYSLSWVLSGEEEDFPLGCVVRGGEDQVWDGIIRQGITEDFSLDFSE